MTDTRLVVLTQHIKKSARPYIIRLRHLMLKDHARPSTTTIVPGQASDQPARLAWSSRNLLHKRCVFLECHFAVGCLHPVRKLNPLEGYGAWSESNQPVPSPARSLDALDPSGPAPRLCVLGRSVFCTAHEQADRSPRRESLPARLEKVRDSRFRLLAQVGN